MEDTLWSDDALWCASSDDEAVLEAALELIEATSPLLPNETVSPAPASPDSSVSLASASSLTDDDSGRGSLEVRVSLGRPLHEQGAKDKTRARRGRPRTVNANGASGPRRNRTKEAIEQLRPLVQALESQLAVLCLRREMGTAKGELEVEDSKKLLRQEAWKAMAERQLAQRRRVEKERHTLREALAEQTATLRKLQRIFTHHENRLRAGMYSGLTLTTPVSALRRSVADGATDVLHSLTLALGQMHLHTDSVLADARFAKPGSSFVQVKTEQEPYNGTLAVQLMDTRLVPFSMERTVNAVWQNLMNRANQQETLGMDVVQSQFLTFVPGFNGHVEASMALRRVVEPSRVVMVRCSVFTYRPEDDGDADPNKTSWLGEPMTLHHFLWTAVSRPSDTERPDECQIQTCFISVPNLSDGDSDKQTAITQLCADVSKYFNADAHDEVDNLLLCGGPDV